MRILTVGGLVIVLGLGLLPLGGCGDNGGQSDVVVGGAVDDPDIEAVNNASSEIPINEIEGNR